MQGFAQGALSLFTPQEFLRTAGVRPHSKGNRCLWNQQRQSLSLKQAKAIAAPAHVSRGRTGACALPILLWTGEQTVRIDGSIDRSGGISLTLAGWRTRGRGERARDAVTMTEKGRKGCRRWKANWRSERERSPQSGLFFSLCRRKQTELANGGRLWFSFLERGKDGKISHHQAMDESEGLEWDGGLVFRV